MTGKMHTLVTEMAAHEDERVDRALRLMLGLELKRGPLSSKDLASAEAAVKRGVHIASHGGYRGLGRRPYKQIRDGNELVIWDGWWTFDGRAYTWREEWAAERR